MCSNMSVSPAFRTHSTKHREWFFNGGRYVQSRRALPDVGTPAVFKLYVGSLGGLVPQPLGSLWTCHHRWFRVVPETDHVTIVTVFPTLQRICSPGCSQKGEGKRCVNSGCCSLLPLGTCWDLFSP